MNGITKELRLEKTELPKKIVHIKSIPLGLLNGYVGLMKKDHNLLIETDHPDHDTISVDRKGTTSYTYQGQLHRLDGPALIFEDGDAAWFLYDKLHRIDGPAVNLKNSKEYYLNDLKYSDYEEYKFMVFTFYKKSLK